VEFENRSEAEAEFGGRLLAVAAQSNVGSGNTLGSGHAVLVRVESASDGEAGIELEIFEIGRAAPARSVEAWKKNSNPPWERPCSRRIKERTDGEDTEERKMPGRSR